MPVCASCGQETPAGFPRCANCGALLEAARPAREQRKTVTVVFCDVAGSTALGESTDPEALRKLLAWYFERMKGIVEAHGGSVEKFIGDAVMAVFGVPVAHEDDALRACRAAIEMRNALPELGVEARIGVNTGEVVTGTEERLATGDAVNVAARLEQTAQSGEVLIGADTLSLVRAAVEVGEMRQLELKGKSGMVASYPLLAVSGELERPFASPMVGRRNEFGRLENVFAQSVRDRSCQLFTILGSAGVGKSRLVSEFLAGLEARVVRGRCLSYGAGITYWPVVEMLKQLATLPESAPARPLRALLGETQESVSAEEIAWGFRMLLEQEAQAEPLVVVFDDLHWAEETLLDLVEHLADLSRDASLLLLCIARPELLERRPGWGGGKWNATAVLLEPLDADETEALLAQLGDVPEQLRDRIVQVAEGNPLFLEEMLALVRDTGSDEVEIPTTIQALLAARLDQLDPEERSVLERGSVEGRTFHRGAVQALADDDGNVEQRLVALVRKELVRPDRALFRGDDAYRFRHLLIRDAAYDALPKAIRAALHRRFAAWLEEHADGLVELDEILGYHLEQAARYLGELGEADPQLADQAAGHLAAAGRRSLWRGDTRAAFALFERALSLMRPYRLDVYLELDLAAALSDVDVSRAAIVAEAAAARAERDGDRVGELLARSVAAEHRMKAGECASEEVEQLAHSTLPLLEAGEDEAGLAHLWKTLAEVANMRGQFEERTRAAEQAFRYARLAHAHAVGLFDLHWALLLGPRPAGNALETLDSLLPEQPPPAALACRAVLLAMLDRFDEARLLAAAVDERLRELGHEAEGAPALADVNELAGDDATAADYLRPYCEHLESAGARSELSTYAPKLGRVLCMLGEYGHAELLAEQGRGLGGAGDAMTQALWRQVKARVLAHRGEHREAERLAREAVAITDRTDMLWAQGDAYCDLASVLEAASRQQEAITTWRQALARYERKQIIPLARRTRERLAALQSTQT